MSKPSSRTSSATRGAKIPVFNPDENDRIYRGDRFDAPPPSRRRDESGRPSYPDFVKSEDYYTTTTSDRSNDYLRGSDVRRQVSQAPAQHGSVAKNYPHTFRNTERLSLASNPPHVEFPITPTGRYTGGEPGAVRAFYNSNDRTTLDVGFHDDRLAPSGPRAGAGNARRPFTQADHYPAPTVIDVMAHQAARSSRSTTTSKPKRP